ncbi:hypothetical protein ACIBF1_44170 [Spirillospora sp. NPDC050679]
MIAVRLPGGPADAAHLVEALLMAAGAIPVPDGAEARRAYLALADQLGDGLDALPAPPAAPIHQEGEEG